MLSLLVWIRVITSNNFFSINFKAMMTTNFKKKARPFRILKQKLSIVWANDQTQDSSRENCDKAKPNIQGRINHKAD